MRRKAEIESKCDEMFDKAWYHRHRRIGSPAIGEAEAFGIEVKYGKEVLDETCEDCAVAILMTLRWVLGDDWGNMDT